MDTKNLYAFQTHINTFRFRARCTHRDLLHTIFRSTRTRAHTHSILEYRFLCKQLAENDEPLPPPPTSPDFLASLATHVVSDGALASNNNDADDTVCGICQDKFNSGDLFHRLPCQHMFHVGCATSWLTQRNTCPTCRYIMPADEASHASRLKDQEERRLELLETLNQLIRRIHHEYHYEEKHVDSFCYREVVESFRLDIIDRLKRGLMPASCFDTLPPECDLEDLFGQPCCYRTTEKAPHRRLGVFAYLSCGHAFHLACLEQFLGAVYSATNRDACICWLHCPECCNHVCLNRPVFFLTATVAAEDDANTTSL